MTTERLGAASLAVFWAVLLWSSQLVAQATLEVEDGGNDPESPCGDVRVLLDNAHAVQGYVIAICQEDGITLESATAGPITAASGDTYESSSVYDGGGVLGVLVSMTSASIVIVGTDQHAATFRYCCDDLGVEGSFDLSLCDATLGTPPKDNLVVADGLHETLSLEDGVFSCTAPFVGDPDADAGDADTDLDAGSGDGGAPDLGSDLGGADAAGDPESDAPADLGETDASGDTAEQDDVASDTGEADATTDSSGEPGGDAPSAADPAAGDVPSTVGDDESGAGSGGAPPGGGADEESGCGCASTSAGGSGGLIALLLLCLLPWRRRPRARRTGTRSSTTALVVGLFVVVAHPPRAEAYELEIGDEVVFSGNDAWVPLYLTIEASDADVNQMSMVVRSSSPGIGPIRELAQGPALEAMRGGSGPDIYVAHSNPCGNYSQVDVYTIFEFNGGPALFEGRHHIFDLRIEGMAGGMTDLTFGDSGSSCSEPAVDTLVEGDDATLISGSLEVVWPFIRGDVNRDGQVDLADAASLSSYLFGGSEAPFCLDAADANDDGVLDLADEVFILDYRFEDGDTPPSPFPALGGDPTEDALTCYGS